MKYTIEKVSDELSIKRTDSRAPQDFDYLEMIDFIYLNGADQVELDFGSSITQDEKDSILKLFSEIQKKINIQKKET